MDTKKLRQKILDLAIHGKLVPQDPNDEPASVLLERIKAEKEQLIKEGKIKRQKKSASSDTSHYGNIPTGWVWTTIGELLINRDGERKPVSLDIRNKQQDKKYDYYGAAGVIDLVDSYLFDDKFLLIGEDGANLLSRSKDNAIIAEGRFWVNNHAHVLDSTNKAILDYVAFVINTMALDDYITGSAQPKLSQDNLNKIPIALPPLNEQQRIIAMIETWHSQIDIIDAEKSSLDVTIQKAKSKILDLALSGRLTSDTSHYGKNEETFSGAALGDVCKLCDGEKIAGKDYTNLDVKYLRGTKSGDMLHSGRFVPAGSLMILVDGENSGEVFTTPVDGYQGSTFKILDIDAKYCKEFILLLIQSNRKSLRENKVGSAIPHLNKKMFKEIVVPPFSYNEQCEIAQTVKDYFCVLDSIVG